MFIKFIFSEYPTPKKSEDQEKNLDDSEIMGIFDEKIVGLKHNRSEAGDLLPIKCLKTSSLWGSTIAPPKSISTTTNQIIT